MNSREIYLDNNATTGVLPEVLDAVTTAMRDGYGNPSSVHEAGSRARSWLREAREAVGKEHEFDAPLARHPCQAAPPHAIPPRRSPSCGADSWVRQLDR